MLDNRQTNRFNMCVATQSYLNETQPIWSVIAICTPLKAEFDTLIAGVREQRKNAVVSSKVLKEKKDALKALISSKIGILAGALAAYAAVKNQPEVLSNGYLKKSDVFLMRDAEVPERVDVFTAVITGLLTELADYGVSELQVTDLEAILDDYRELVGLPRRTIAKAQVAKKEAGTLIDEAVSLLNEKMDNVMLPFEETHPTFYEGYKRARVIVD